MGADMPSVWTPRTRPRARRIDPSRAEDPSWTVTRAARSGGKTLSRYLGAPSLASTGHEWPALRTSSPPLPSPSVATVTGFLLAAPGERTEYESTLRLLAATRLFRTTMTFGKRTTSLRLTLVNAVFALTLLLGGCGPSRESAVAGVASQEDQLRSRASFDMQCPKDSIRDRSSQAAADGVPFGRPLHDGRRRSRLREAGDVHLGWSPQRLAPQHGLVARGQAEVARPVLDDVQSFDVELRVCVSEARRARPR